MSISTKRVLMKVTLALSFAILSFAHASAQLTTIYSDFATPPAPLYNSSSGWLVSGSASPYGAYAEAMAFTPTVTRKLDFVDVAMSYYSGSPLFNVELRKDCGGLPCGGPAMYTWTAMTATFTYGTCCGIERTPTDADQAAFAGRQYWIVASVKPGSDAALVWNMNNIGATGNLALSTDGGLSWTHYSAQLAAFDALGH